MSLRLIPLKAILLVAAIIRPKIKEQLCCGLAAMDVLIVLVSTTRSMVVFTTTMPGCVREKRFIQLSGVISRFEVSDGENAA